MLNLWYKFVLYPWILALEYCFWNRCKLQCTSFKFVQKCPDDHEAHQIWKASESASQRHLLLRVQDSLVFLLTFAGYPALHKDETVNMDKVNEFRLVQLLNGLREYKLSKNCNDKLCNHMHIFSFHSDRWSQNRKEEGNFLPVQFSPSPRNPGLQEQVCELSAFLHVALVWQSNEDATHSSASDQKRNFEGHWLVLVLVACVSGCVSFLLVPTFCH